MKTNRQGKHRRCAFPAGIIFVHIDFSQLNDKLGICRAEPEWTVDS